MSAEEQIRKELARGKPGRQPILAEPIMTGDPIADGLAKLERRVDAIDRTLILVGQMIDGLNRP